jgi:hypothetical protein
MIELFHFTSREGLTDILVDDQITPNPTPVSLDINHAGVSVVWLTTLRNIPLLGNTVPSRWDDPEQFPLGLETFPLDKSAVRFTLKLDKRHVTKWSKWARSRGIPDETVRILSSRGSHSNTWYVIERPIIRDEWMKIDDSHTDQLFWLRPEEQDTSQTSSFTLDNSL